MKVVTWDWKEQPDWDAINDEMSALQDDYPHLLFFRIETNEDRFGVVIAPADWDSGRAQNFYDKMTR